MSKTGRIPKIASCHFWGAHHGRRIHVKCVQSVGHRPGHDILTREDQVLGSSGREGLG